MKGTTDLSDTTPASILVLDSSSPRRALRTATGRCVTASCLSRAPRSFSLAIARCFSTNAAAVTSNNVVENSAFYDVGATAVRVGLPGSAEDTDANLPQFTAVQNNVVEGYGRVFPGSYGITQGQAHDNTYTHNDIYDGYRAAVGICYCSGFKPDSHDNVIAFADFSAMPRRSRSGLVTNKSSPTS